MDTHWGYTWAGQNELPLTMANLDVDAVECQIFHKQIPPSSPDYQGADPVMMSKQDSDE